MPYRASSNNTKAGAFLLISLIIALLIILQLAVLLKAFKPHRDYFVQFSLTDGAAGLSLGSDVRIAGQSVGKVGGIKFKRRDSDDVIEGVLVRIELQTRYKLFDDAVAFLEQPLLGSGSTINFAGVGGGPGATVLEAGEVIKGELAVPSFLASAGYGAEQKEQVRSIVSKIEGIADRFNAFAAKLDGQVLADAQIIVEDIRDVTDELRGRYPLWFERADSITADIESAAQRADQTVAEAQQFVVSLQDLVDENRPRVDGTIEGAEEIVDRLNTRSIQLLDEMLINGRATTQNARAAIDEFALMIDETTPDIRKAVANARIASDQMKLAMGEIRRAPWRALQRPDKKELEYELLYDSARSFASAISDLRAASEALEITMESPRAESQFGQEQILQLLANIESRMEAYKGAEDRFLDLLIQQ